MVSTTAKKLRVVVYRSPKRWARSTSCRAEIFSSRQCRRRWENHATAHHQELASRKCEKLSEPVKDRAGLLEASGGSQVAIVSHRRILVGYRAKAAKTGDPRHRDAVPLTRSLTHGRAGRVNIAVITHRCSCRRDRRSSHFYRYRQCSGDRGVEKPTGASPAARSVNMRKRRVVDD